MGPNAETLAETGWSFYSRFKTSEISYILTCLEIGRRDVEELSHPAHRTILRRQRLHVKVVDLFLLIVLLGVGLVGLVELADEVVKSHVGGGGGGGGLREGGGN